MLSRAGKEREREGEHAQHIASTERPPAVLNSTVRLLRCLGDLFREQEPTPASGGRFVDSKLRRKIQEKKIAMGHKPDDHASMTTS